MYGVVLAFLLFLTFDCGFADLDVLDFYQDDLAIIRGERNNSID